MRPEQPTHPSSYHCPASESLRRLRIADLKLPVSHKQPSNAPRVAWTGPERGIGE
jgi:hypothetical protein